MKPAYRDKSVAIYQGHALDVLPQLPEESVHCSVTSPPYWGLRDYGIEPQVWGGDSGCNHWWTTERVSAEIRTGLGLAELGKQYRGGGKKQGSVPRIETERSWCRRCGAWRGSLGLEPTPELYVEHIVAVFREVRRVLRKDGTLWLNMGDSYCNSDKWGGGGANTGKHTRAPDGSVESWKAVRRKWNKLDGVKPKDLIGMPWLVAFALRADGWYLRAEIIWHKPNPMPESVRDRPTKAHEQVFLLSKSGRYFYDAEAIREAGDPTDHNGKSAGKGSFQDKGEPLSGRLSFRHVSATRNKRSVWTIPTAPFPGAHFAVFPPDLIKPCILAGTSAEGCCPKCGAPWRRVTEKTRIRTRPGKNSKSYDRTTGEIVDDGMEKPWRDRAEIGNRDPGRHVTKTNTTGWKPGCDCQAGPPVPCTVLDPFLGSGTSAMVAKYEGRRAIGIELNPEYIEMAKPRVSQEILPLGAV